MTSAMAMFVTFLVMAVNKFSPKTDMFLSVLILIFMISAGVACVAADVERTQTHINTIQEAGVPELADYFQSTVGMSDVSYNKDTKTLVIDTNKSSDSENITGIDAKLAKNSKIKSVDFTSAGGRKQASHMVVIVKLK
jgi:hypothetical protein